MNNFSRIISRRGYTRKSLIGFSSAKTEKGESLGYLTGILYLTPSIKLCPFSIKAGCFESCLKSAGRGAFNSVQKARKIKTELFENNREEFMLNIAADIESAIIKAKKLGYKLLIRLNGTSDIQWENIAVINGQNIFELFPETQFYDYTKRPNRNNIPSNYDLTYSFSGITPKHITEKALANTNNARTAVVFHRREDIPASFNNLRVIDGDNSDVRHIEPRGVIVALYAKGKAKKENQGFVQYKGRDY